ncbi:hypothetical protein [Phytoactinopolyspora halotolerans]|uniref:Uncharacterized protein n=1 Tax=Phytoactinopolyspora halotolerans TaxID=1981512 RepID=A0A6L9S822_9ACTN|nr:hypothetical protein [Phytoactinopolyspora halotolerans]NEE00841.1 hypothetical protein [Phytoactinopolyspora halotolerans]
MAALPDGVIEKAKAALVSADLTAGYLQEEAAWSLLVGQPAAQQLMRTALQQGAQSSEGEADLESVMRSVSR